MKKLFFILVWAGLNTFTSISAFADSAPVSIGTFGDWKAYHYPDKGGKVCFMTSQPQKQEGKFKKRDEVDFFVTRWPDAKNKNVISVTNGYTFKAGSPVILNIGDKKFELSGREDTAWTKDPAEDEEVIKFLQKGSSMRVIGTSARGTETTDTYGLKGTADAFRAMVKECASKQKNAGDK